jgi:hypothetical protein
MSEGPPGATRWDQVCGALLRLRGQLPPEDPVTIGSFAEDVRWWSRGRPARETAGLQLPPADVSPHGPTNLEAALLDIIAHADSAMHKELLILSDADADIADAAKITAALKEKKITLHLLDTYGKGRGAAVLRQLARDTGGQVVEELDATRWISASQKLLSMASPNRLMTAPAEVRFIEDLHDLATRLVQPWNRTWLKKGAAAQAEANTEEGAIVLAARWQVGAGQVIAAAFPTDSREIQAIGKLVEKPPRDPRFSVSFDAGQELRVSIDAVDGGRYLNGLPLSLEVSGTVTQAIPQTAPGRYELTMAAPRHPVFAAVRHDGRILQRIAVAGRYAPEFDAIGNNRQRMEELARRSGGHVILPNHEGAIRFNWPRNRVPLASWLSALGVLFIATGLVRWRFR